MPDHYAAATEHELMTTITEPLGKLPEDPLALVAVDFPVALRGYDRVAVDAYVERTAQLVAELQSTRSPEAAVRRALERVGEEISGILQRAHETADEITARSRSEAEERLETVRREAVEITAQAELRVKELDAETERIWVERHSIVTDARDLARRLTELAESALERFPAAPPPEGGDSAGAIPPETSAGGAAGVGGAALEAPVSPHLFDGAAEAPEAPEPGADDEPAFAPPAFEPPAFEPPAFEPPTEDRLGLDQPTEYDPAVDQPTEDHLVDQPTVEAPPLAPPKAAGGLLDAGGA